MPWRASSKALRMASPTSCSRRLWANHRGTTEKRTDSMTDLDQTSLDGIDTSKPHPARMYDFYLQGKDYYEADEIAGKKVLEVFPTIKITARVNRSFMHRATRYLAAEAGVRQFLDIGTGIPTR